MLVVGGCSPGLTPLQPPIDLGFLCSPPRSLDRLRGVQCHSGANERLQCLFINLVALVEIVRELAGTIEDLRTEALRKLACPINLLTRVGVEGDVMQPYLVNLEWMLGKLRLCFLEI